MTRRDVEGEILQAIDTFVAGGGRLPETVDGKVNVAALCRSLQLRVSDVQHVFRKDALKTVVNALASEQELMPIGARAEREAADASIQDSLVRARSSARRDAQAATEQSAGASALLEELQTCRFELEACRLEAASLRERLRMIEDGEVAPACHAN